MPIQKRIRARIEGGLASFVKAIYLCGLMEKPLRGSEFRTLQPSNNVYDLPNPREGLFNAFLYAFLDSGDNALRDHLEMSPVIFGSATHQNVFIDLIRENIQARILNDVRESRFFSVLADGTTDVARIDQLALVLRYINKNNIIVEEFLEYVSISNDTSGQGISNIILERLRFWNLKIEGLRGQGYDGAANMAGWMRGAHAIIQREYPLAMYVHCWAHSLNLALLTSCKNILIRNHLMLLNELSNYFGSAKRADALKKEAVRLKTKGRTVLKVCETRWTNYAMNTNRMLCMFPALIEALKTLAKDNNVASKRGAENLLKQLLNFEHILSAFVAHEVLGKTKRLSESLQTKNNYDYAMAMRNVRAVRDSVARLQQYTDERNEFLRGAWNRTVDLLSNHNVNPSIPRLSKAKMASLNLTKPDPFDYYERVLAAPFINSVVSALDDRFGKRSPILAKLSSLIPSVLVAENLTQPTAGDFDTHFIQSVYPQHAVQLRENGGTRYYILNTDSTGRGFHWFVVAITYGANERDAPRTSQRRELKELESRFTFIEKQLGIPRGFNADGNEYMEVDDDYMEQVGGAENITERMEADDLEHMDIDREEGEEMDKGTNSIL
ncbi:zinc finger MYM-type protein 1-like [Paramacrobiotus metropolitanus]|uniref:zinc finger MYM-type protein 1-like n=1 Tax=Paramacrobiotus metropolitanus TaxID=2943436 RepID=UPI0024464EFA|nr:zinc finger MYM-type protein 1-like [Paramacrobiotus metropolitanus]